MNTFYHVIYYTPDPVRDERFNVAIIAGDTSGDVAQYVVRVRKDFSLINQYCGHDVGSLVTEAMESAAKSVTDLSRLINRDRGAYTNLIASEIRRSLCSLSELADDVSKIFL